MAADYALATTEDVRALLQKPSGDNQQDPVIERLIERASVVIRNRFGKFLPKEDAAVKTFAMTAGRRVNLAPYFLRGATQVRIDVEGSYPSTLASGDYQLRPLSPLDGVYRWLRLPDQYLLAGRVERHVEVTGNWGYNGIDNLPQDVRQACAITVVEWMRKDVSAFSTAFSIDEGRVDRPEALPGAAYRMLLHYDRGGQG